MVEDLYVILLVAFAWGMDLMPNCSPRHYLLSLPGYCILPIVNDMIINGSWALLLFPCHYLLSLLCCPWYVCLSHRSSSTVRLVQWFSWCFWCFRFLNVTHFTLQVCFGVCRNNASPQPPFLFQNQMMTINRRGSQYLLMRMSRKNRKTGK